MILDPTTAWTFRFHLRCNDVAAHLAPGGRARLDQNVRARLAALGTVVRLDTETVDAWITADVYSGAVVFRPSASRDTERELAAAIVDGANAGAPPGTRPFGGYGTVWTVFTGWSSAEQYPLSTVITDVRRGDLATAPTSNPYTLLRPLDALSTNDQGQTLAGVTVAQATTANPLVTAAVVGGIALLALVAIGYGLRPIAQLAGAAK